MKTSPLLSKQRRGGSSP